MQATPDSSDLRLTESGLDSLGLHLGDAISQDFDILGFEAHHASPEQGTGSCTTSHAEADHKLIPSPGLVDDGSALGATSSSGGAGSETCRFPRQEAGSKRKTPLPVEDEGKRQVGGAILGGNVNSFSFDRKNGEGVCGGGPPPGKGLRQCPRADQRTQPRIIDETTGSPPPK